jgi:drug/metabolite transporter (DMT)-like permease
MLNLEPFISIGAAMLLLGERLQLSQSLGVLVVISALFMASGLTRKFSISSKSE